MKVTEEYLIREIELHLLQVSKLLQNLKRKQKRLALLQSQAVKKARKQARRKAGKTIWSELKNQ